MSTSQVLTGVHTAQCSLEYVMKECLVKRTYLKLLFVHLHLLQLVSDSLCVPGSVVSLQVIKFHIAETLLQLLKGVTKLKDYRLESQVAELIS